MMGYFQGKQLYVVLDNISNGLASAMDKLNKEEGLINMWSFSKEGDILLYQEYKCGCNKIIEAISLDIKKEEIDVIGEEEFIMQIEDMLIEINDRKGYDNFLLNVADCSKIVNKCEKCT